MKEIAPIDCFADQTDQTRKKLQSSKEFDQQLKVSKFEQDRALNLEPKSLAINLKEKNGAALKPKHNSNPNPPSNPIQETKDEFLAIDIDDDDDEQQHLLHLHKSKSGLILQGLSLLNSFGLGQVQEIQSSEMEMELNTTENNNINNISTESIPVDVTHPLNQTISIDSPQSPPEYSPSAPPPPYISKSKLPPPDTLIHRIASSILIIDLFLSALLMFIVVVTFFADANGDNPVALLIPPVYFVVAFYGRFSFKKSRSKGMLVYSGAYLARWSGDTAVLIYLATNSLIPYLDMSLFTALITGPMLGVRGFYPELFPCYHLPSTSKKPAPVSPGLGDSNCLDYWGNSAGTGSAMTWFVGVAVVQLLAGVIVLWDAFEKAQCEEEEE